MTTTTTGDSGLQPQGEQQQFSMDERIERCMTCYRACEQAVGAALDLGEEGSSDVDVPVRLLVDCAEICQLSAGFMIRGSELHGVTCGACADVCERCADACARVDDPLIKSCADACRDCAASCRAMAEGHHHM
jgi:hypothetical protein